jgi:hypothetical protein
MAKRSPDAELAAGEARLIEWGAPADAGLDALLALIGRDPAADAAIAHRLGAIASDESARLLQRLERESADKPVRREARRALYRLQQRGVPAANDQPTPTTVQVAALSPSIEAQVSSVDGSGDQLVWLVRPQTGGVMHLFAVVNDPEGLREVALHSASRKALKSLRQDLERHHEVRLVPIDWRHADFIVHRAFQWARAAGTRMEGDYPGLRAQLSRAAPADTSPLPPPAADAEALARSAELIGDPELRTWFRSPQELEPFLREFGDVQDSPLVLNELQQQERYDDIIARAIDTIFGGDARESWSRRLTELGRYLQALRRPERSAEAAAVAAALAAGAAPRDLPFCNQLVRVSLALFMQMAAQQEEERAKSSLVVTPQQAARQRPPR